MASDCRRLPLTVSQCPPPAGGTVHGVIILWKKPCGFDLIGFLLKSRPVMETPKSKQFKIYLPLAILILLYLITRLYGLAALPMSSEEATWIHWAQIVAQYPSEWLIASDNGEQPLFTWLNAVTLNIFPDPLAAGRWVSVLAGLASLTGLYFIGQDLVNRTVGLLASLIYIIFPYAFFCDRLALPDGLAFAGIIWALRWSLHIAKETRPQEKAFKTLGVLMCAACLADLIAGLAFPVLLAVFYIWRVHKRPEFWKQFGMSVGIVLVVNLPILINASSYETNAVRYEKGVSSGVGLRQAAKFLEKEAEAFRKKTGVPLPVLLPMSPGNPAEGITVFLWKNPDVRFVPAFWWPRSPKLIPTGLRFSHRPSIYQTSPVKRRETSLLNYAHFIFPGGGYSQQKLLQENPRFEIAWSSQKLGKRRSIIILKNRPHK